MTKSEAAFRFSAQKFFDQQPSVYFWTFTFRDVYPDWFYSRMWAGFVKDLQNLYGGTLSGVRVIEFHQSHGIHYHALFNHRIWVGEARKLGKRHGIGRVHVKVADLGAVGYLAKYLTKQWASENPSFSGCARWGTVGRFRGCRVRDVSVSGSALQQKVRWAQEYTGLKRLPFPLVLALKTQLFADRLQVMALCHKLIPTSIAWTPQPVLSEDRDRHLQALSR